MHTRCGAVRGAGVSFTASGSGSSEASEGADASGDGGEAAFEAFAGAVALPEGDGSSNCPSWVRFGRAQKRWMVPIPELPQLGSV